MPRTFGIFVVLLGTAGCAAVFKETSPRVVVRSQPSGAVVTEGGIIRGTTPVAIPISRGKNVYYDVSKPGYAPRPIAVPRSTDTGWMVADIATCILPVLLCIPLIVDAASGSFYDYEDDLTAVLTPLGEAPPPAVPMPGPGAAPRPGATPAPSAAPRAPAAPSPSASPSAAPVPSVTPPAPAPSGAGVKWMVP